MSIQHLPPVAIDGHKPSGLGGPDHPMRIVTRRAAGLEPGGWTNDLRRDVEKFFDDLAPEWHLRDSGPRIAVVRDALSRGLDHVGRRHGVAVEVGSGTGTYSELLADRFETVVAVDLSLAMLKLAPRGPAHRAQADGSRLPLANSSASAIVLINAFLFPDEVARVLTCDGILVWVNSSGEQTPIYLSPDELVDRLPGEWTGVASRAGAGSWCVVRRVR